MPKSGDIILTRMQFIDGQGSKIRPALVLFEDLDNIVIAGITTNLQMKGVHISTKEGAAQESIIKLNYIFTIANEAILKTVFHLSTEKKRLIFDELSKKLEGLKA
ncbi:MAG: type II toxin-antitoxin system PemK/MazF family toxin [Candidatus Micrarchaeaceae archaeon]